MVGFTQIYSGTLDEAISLIHSLVPSQGSAISSQASCNSDLSSQPSPEQTRLHHFESKHNSLSGVSNPNSPLPQAASNQHAAAMPAEPTSTAHGLSSDGRPAARSLFAPAGGVQTDRLVAAKHSTVDTRSHGHNHHVKQPRQNEVINKIKAVRKTQVWSNTTDHVIFLHGLLSYPLSSGHDGCRCRHIASRLLHITCCFPQFSLCHANRCIAC